MDVQRSSPTVEHITHWVKKEANIHQIAETFAAVANQSGGIIALEAAHDPDLLKARIIEACFSLDPVLVIPAPQTGTWDSKAAVIVRIPSDLQQVYSYNGRYLYREGQQNILLSPLQLRQLMLARSDIPFEANIAAGSTLDDINWGKVREYARSLAGFSDQDAQAVLLKRGCLKQSAAGIVPTYAGILLFGNDPQRFVLNSDIAAVRFAGDTMTDSFNRQDIGGTLPEQIRRCETFLSDHLRKEVLLKDSMQREEGYEYPMEAARELVINAVAHRDYSLRGDNIHIYIFSKRMEVHSPGKLPGPMTVANLKEERFSRNPIIVQVLSDMHFIEKLGYGVDRVIELMQTRNLSAPIFMERAGGFHVILHRKGGKPQAKTAIKPSIELPVSDFNGIYRGQEINPRQEKALVFLHVTGNQRITNGDLKDLFPDTHPETLRRDLADLVTKDILVKLGQKRGSYYVLKQPANQK